MNDLLFQPVTFGRLELRNRFMRSATHERLTDETGAVTEHAVALYEALAKGGVGLISTGYAFVSEGGRAAYHQYGIHRDEMIEGFANLATVVHKHGARLLVQIVHCGGRPPESSYYDPLPSYSEDEIGAIIGDFASAAARVREAGCDGVQLHGAHGYLFSQFLSPLKNVRLDRWGGDSENRRRFHLTVVQRIRAAVGPDFPIHMKIGIMDDEEGGLSLEDGIATARAMMAVGLDAVEISGGIGRGKASPIRAFRGGVADYAYYRERAARTRREAGIAVAVTGGIRRLATAREIIWSGDADLVGMCRPFIREPNLVGRWLAGDERDAACITCAKCVRGDLVPVRCVDQADHR